MTLQGNHMVIMEARVGLILSNAALLVFDEAAVEMANTKSAHAVTSIKHQASSTKHQALSMDKVKV